MTRGRATFQLGLRFDYNKDEAGASSIVATSSDRLVRWVFRCLGRSR